MKAIGPHFVVGCLVCLLVFLTGTARARDYVRVGFGMSFGHHHSFHYRHHYPHHRWHGGHKSYHSPWYRHSYYPGYLHPSGSDLWIYQAFPIIPTPPLDDRTQKETEYFSGLELEYEELSQSVRQYLNEQFRALKIGGKEERLAAIRKLATYSFVSRVRATLENVLLSDPDPELRKQVATSFGNTADPEAMAALEAAKAKDPDKGVLKAVYRAIIMIEGY